jgi:hypothetical protein
MSLRCLTPFCALAGLLTAGWAVAQQPDRPAFPGGGGRGARSFVRTAWEYRALDRTEIMKLAPEQKEKDQFAGGLNKLGAEAWELVAVAPGSGRMEYVFKRPAGRTLRGGPAAAPPRPPAPAAPAAASAPEIKMFRLKNARAADMERTLAKMFQGGGRAGLRIASDERTNSVLVSGAPTQLDEVEAVLNRLDTPDGAKPPPRK